MVFFLTLPACTACCRSKDHRTLHSINARTAFFTMAVGALCKSCATLLDCTLQPDGTPTLDVLPDLTCWKGIHIVLAPAGVVMMLLYCVLVPQKLFLDLKQSSSDGKWTEDELEKHAWLLLKYKPSRWWFEFALLYNKIFFILLSVVLNSDKRAWHLLGALTLLTSVTLILVAVDRPFRMKNGVNMDGIMIMSQATQLANYGVAAVCLRSKEERLKEGLFGASDEVTLFATVMGFMFVLLQLLAVIYVYDMEHKAAHRRKKSGKKRGVTATFQNPMLADKEYGDDEDGDGEEDDGGEAKGMTEDAAATCIQKHARGKRARKRRRHPSR